MNQITCRVDNPSSDIWAHYGFASGDYEALLTHLGVLILKVWLYPLHIRVMSIFFYGEKALP